MSGNILQAPHGMNLVIERKSGGVVIGRFDSANGFEVAMHDVDVWEPGHAEERERWIRTNATYGVAVSARDYSFPQSDVRSWVPLGQIEKLK
jgi:hypothetical protein